MLKKNLFSLLTISLVLMLSLSFASAVTESVSIEDYILDFEYEEEDVEAGETFRLEVTVTNEAGETREDIEIKLDLKSPFDEVGDDEKTISSLDDQESKTVSFRIEVDEDAEEDDYTIEFEFQDNVIDEDDEFDVEVESNKAELIIGNIESLPTVISPDTEDVKLTLNIENIGEEDAEAVRIKLDLPSGFSASGSFSDIANLGTIPQGDNKEVVFFIDTDEIIPSGSYEGILDIDYENDGDSETEKLEFDLPLKGRPQFVVERSTTNPNPLVAGSQGSIRITVRNIGEEEGEETSIRVFENSDQPLEFNEKTNFIGDLQPGEAGTGIITFNVENGEANTYIVRMQVRTISEGNVIVEEHSVSIKVNEGEPINLGFYVIGVFTIALFVALIFLFRMGRRK